MTVTINGTSGVTAPEVTLDNSAADGGQVVLKSSGYSNWNIDNYNGSLRNYYGSTVATTIDSSGNVGIGTSSPTTKLHIEASTGTARAITLSDTGGATPVILGNTISGGTANFVATVGGSERMRIDSSGNLLVGTTSQVNSGLFCSVGNLNNIYTATFKNTATQGAGQSFVYMVNSAGNKAGSIDHTGTTTVAYTTSSDYRLKENVQPMVGALDKVLQLNPVTYRWKEDKKDGQGFIAHELQAVVPDCVTGKKDAVDEEGNPVYQGIDTSFLVATLTKAIQELTARVEQLEAKNVA